MVNLEKIIKKEWMNVLFNILFMVFSILVVVIFFKNILLTNMLLLLILIIGLLNWKSKLSLIIFIVFGVMFGIAEIIVSSLGPWNYSVSNLLTIPSWLFLLWGNTAVFIHQIIREIRKFGIKENKLNK